MTGRTRSTGIRCSRCSRGPTGSRSGVDFRETLVGHLLVSGNAYVEAVALDGSARANSMRSAPTG